MTVRRAFEAWAKSITTLAETHLSTLQHGDSNEASPTEPSAANVGSLRSYSSSATPSPPMSMGSAEPTPSPVSPPQPQRTDSQASSITSSTSHPQKPTPTPTPAAAVTPVSSFLSAKSVDPDGYPRSSLSAASPLANVSKTRSLAEIVGDEYFFVRLHAEFCGLLKSLTESEIAEKGPEVEDGNDVIDEEEQRYESGSDDNAVHSGEEDEDDGCVVGWDRY
jgi:hypothetical protein